MPHRAIAFRVALTFLFCLAFAPGICFAEDPVKIYVDFTGSGLSDDEKKDFLKRVREKYDSKVGDFNIADHLMFVDGKPPKGAKDPHIIRFDPKGTPSNYGETTGNTSDVNVGKLLKGHWRNIFNDPTDPNRRAKQVNSMVDTAAHELTHQFLPGEGHNCNAPNAKTETKDANGKTFVRTPGNGTLVGGRPGLMASGDKTTPEENADDKRTLTDEEKKTIANSVQKEINGESTKPGASGKQTDLEFIEGKRPDPENPPNDDPLSLDEMDDWVDVDLMLTGNSLWDFGYVTRDGGFLALVNAGITDTTLAFEPGTVVNFAIRRVGEPDGTRLALSDGGYLENLSDIVSAGNAMKPYVSDDYFRFVVLRFNDAPDFHAILSGDATKRYDGFTIASVPEPSAIVFAGVSAFALFAALRRRKK